MDDLGRGRCSASLSDHGHYPNDHGKKKYFEGQKKMKKDKFIISNTGHPSPLNDFRELTSPVYLYIFITFFSQLSKAVRPPLPITRAAKVSTFLEEKEREGE